ncbi:MAG: hypothetical protein NT007_01685 [Candidatus Kapabacteria bacterium]|nr:hypothetical protein [Candidatus Kapabacteria bacterium]
MELKYKLLDHPFYKAWSDGTVTEMQLSKYAYSYQALVEEIPDLWAKVINSFAPDSKAAAAIISEETSHVTLWELWTNKLTKPELIPEMNQMISELHEMNPSQLLGAIQAFEIQQPEVSKSKSDGLKKYYKFSNDNLKYFFEHENEHSHIEYGQQLAATLADSDDYKFGFERGSELFYKNLDIFVN